MRSWCVRFVVVALVIAACGRFDFEPLADAGSTLAITSPPPNTQAREGVMLVGSCAKGLPIELSGAISPTSGDCSDGTFAIAVTFTFGDGVKSVVATQGAASVERSFVRVTPVAELRSGSSGIVSSSGFNVDCDLIVGLPSETAPGDFLIGIIYTDGGDTGAIATPGWTRLALTGASYAAFYKIAGAEPPTYSFRITAGTGAADTCESAGSIIAVANATAVLAESGEGTGSSTELVASSVNAPQDALLVGLFGSNGPMSGIAAPPGMLLVAAIVSTGDFANTTIAIERVTAGPTGQRVGMLSAPRGGTAGLVVLNAK